MFDAVVVCREAVADAPQNGLGAAGDIDPAIDRSNVRLHCVWAEVGERCHLGIAAAAASRRATLLRAA